jgi:FAD dependent oxidoreductase
MSFRIAIIGAGWYGCHIGLSLASLGMDVQIFDKCHRPLHRASGNNQFRLHQGFHYARHYGTRLQSRDGFTRFIERYPTLSAEVQQNIYAVPRETSLVDFATYKLVMISSGLNFIESTDSQGLLTGVEGMMLTDERVLLIDRARRYFSARLESALQLDTKIDKIEEAADSVVVNGRKYDYVVDASWGHRGGLPLPVIYEPTLLLYYEAAEYVPAVTFVDGPLCSVYPTEDPKIYTLSSVVHTPLGRFDHADAAEACLRNVDTNLVDAKRHAMEAQISVNMPSFRERFRFMGIQLAIKTKLIGNFDDRSCYVYQNGRTFTVLSGKIDTVFFATERILSLIESSNSDLPAYEGQGIKEDILIPGTTAAAAFS